MTLVLRLGTHAGREAILYAIEIAWQQISAIRVPPDPYEITAAIYWLESFYQIPDVGISRLLGYIHAERKRSISSVVHHSSVISTEPMREFIAIPLLAAAVHIG